VRVPGIRSLLMAGAAAVAASVLAAAALTALDAVSGGVAVLLVVNVAVLAGLAVTGALVLRADHRLVRLAKDARETAGRDAERVAGIGRRLDEIDAHVGTAREWVSKDVFTAYQQVEAMIDLRSLVRPRAPMPALRHWALSPDALRYIIREIHARRPGLIVECGSGASSVWLGYTVEALGTGRIVALEHDERFAEISRDLVRAHGLQDVVEVRHAPLVPWKGEDGPEQWYDTAAAFDLEGIDLLVVDGPPGTGGPAARYPAVPELLARCSADALILLDDAHRAGEKAVSDRWLTENADLARTEHAFDKHLHAFQRGSAVPAQRRP
jgi:predicted O-methyltransferase YrrM